MGFDGFSIPSLKELYARPYDERMLEWRRRGARDKAANILGMVGERASEIATVLEVGAGTGDVLNCLSDAGFGKSLAGIEIGDARLASSSPRPNVTLSYFDGSRIAAPDQSFDLVYATHVLEHVVHERAFLHELARVARRYVYVEVPLEIHARTTWKSLNTTLQIGHINQYDRHGFVLKLETSGLKVLDHQLFDHSFAVQSFGGTPARAAMKMTLRRLGLLAGIGSLFLSYHCGALCVPAAKLDIA